MMASFSFNLHELKTSSS